MNGEYYIYRNGILIGEKQIRLREGISEINIEIQVDFADVERRIEVCYSNEKKLISFGIDEIFKGRRTLNYKSREYRPVRINDDVIIDEVFFACYTKTNKEGHMYDILNTNNNSLYKLRLFKKAENKYNILVPTYAYLEYDNEGLLEYMEDFIDGIQVMRQ